MRCQILTALFRIEAERLQILLKRGERGWTLPDADLLDDRPLEACALSALPETGQRNLYLEQLYTYGDLMRPAGRVVRIVYFALFAADESLNLTAAAARFAWFPVDGLPALIDDQAAITAYALRRLRYKLEYTAAGFELLPDTFTLSELQRTYEIVLGEQLDKRNFRRRILQAGIIEPTGEKRRQDGSGRPAALYRYRPDAIAEVKTRRLFP